MNREEKKAFAKRYIEIQCRIQRRGCITARDRIALECMANYDIDMVLKLQDTIGSKLKY